MLEFFKAISGLPIVATPLGQQYFDEPSGEPVGTIVYEEGKFRLVQSASPAEYDALLRDYLRSREIFDAFSLVQALEERIDIDSLPIADPVFNNSLTLFYGHSICSLLNRHGAAFGHLAAAMPNAMLGFISTGDIHEIMKLIQGGYHNHGMQTVSFFVPIYTAFPLASPAIGVSLKMTSSSTQKSGFKFTLPGVSGGFSGSSTTSFTVAHPTSAIAIQFQQEMEAQIITWKNPSTGHEIRSYSFQKLSGQQIEYDDSSIPGNSFIRCNVANCRSKIVKELTIRPNPSGAAVPTAVGIGKSYSESLNFDADKLVPGINLDIETETEDDFEAGYDLVPGYKYTFRGSRQDTHFISPESVKV